jgi:hypothetical protein
MMKRRHPNPRLAKIHRTYTVAEVADLFGLHRNTVRQWIKSGLPVLDDRRPALVFGRDLRDFLQARREKNKRKCQPAEIYCVKCREPRRPAGGIAEYRPSAGGLGSLIGICPECDCFMYRRTSEPKLEQIRGELEVTFSQASTHIGDSNRPSPNSDFKQE